MDVEQARLQLNPHVDCPGHAAELELSPHAGQLQRDRQGKRQDGAHAVCILTVGFGWVDS